MADSAETTGVLAKLILIVVAGLIVWFCVYVYAGILSGALLAITVHLLALGIIWGLVEYSFGAVLGAWVYKEA